MVILISLSSLNFLGGDGLERMESGNGYLYAKS